METDLNIDRDAVLESIGFDIDKLKGSFAEWYDATREIAEKTEGLTKVIFRIKFSQGNEQSVKIPLAQTDGKTVWREPYLLVGSLDKIKIDMTQKEGSAFLHILINKIEESVKKCLSSGDQLIMVDLKASAFVKDNVNLSKRSWLWVFGEESVLKGVSFKL